MAAFAHFSAMPGSTGAGLGDADRAVVAEVGRRYDSHEHLRNRRRPHRAALDAGFVDRFAVVGPPEACVERLTGLAALGVDRFVLTGAELRRRPRRRPHRRPPAHHRDSFPPCESETSRMSEHDLIIRGGTVLDGTGAAARTADVAIADGVVTEVGRVDGTATRTIDADGLLVTPGFVDIHAHYDGQASWGERMIPSSWHGVTTVVAGNCGVGFAPVQPARTTTASSS